MELLSVSFANNYEYVDGSLNIYGLLRALSFDSVPSNYSLYAIVDVLHDKKLTIS